ncbi:Purine nucleoside phosphorylase [Taenia solium]|eukprot:TsM_000570000 transcript=TsM_000570000 gene=TsM_000570000
MSTTAEITAAHHAEMYVLALSLVTNRNILDTDQTVKANYEEVLETGLCHGDMIATMLTHILAAL